MNACTRIGAFIGGLLCCALIWLAAPARAADAAPPVSFHKQVLPIFKEACTGCHYPGKLKGELDLTKHAAFAKGGESGAALVPGKPDESLVIEQISGPNPEMPSKGEPLRPEQVALIRLWIEQGAKDDTPAGADVHASAPTAYRVAPAVTAIAYSPDGTLFAVSGYCEIVLHQPDGKGIMARLAGDAPRIESLAFSADGKWLAMAGGAPGRYGEIQIWNVAERSLHRSYKIGSDSLYGVSFSADAAQVAFGCADKTARLIQVEDGKELMLFRNHADWVLGTCFSVDGKQLVTAGRDKALKIIDLNTKRFVDDINNPLERVFSFARHPGKNMVLYGGDLGTPRLYNISDNQKRTAGRNDTNLVRAFERQPGTVYAVAFSPDGELIAVGSTGDEVRVYKVGDGQRVATLKGHEGAVYALAFRPDGKQLCVGGYDGKLRIYEVANGALVQEAWPVPMQPENALSQSK